MRRTGLCLPTALVLLGAAVGCGQQTGSGGSGPTTSERTVQPIPDGTSHTDTDPHTTGSSTGGSAGESPAADDFRVVVIITATAAGGRVSSAAVRLERPADVRSFAASSGLTAPLSKQVQRAARQPLVAGRTLYAAVIGLGCEAPDDVLVTRSGSAVRMQAPPGPSDVPEECFAAMTTVALVESAT